MSEIPFDYLSQPLRFRVVEPDYYLTTVLRNSRKALEPLRRNGSKALIIYRPNLYKLAEHLANTAVSL